MINGSTSYASEFKHLPVLGKFLLQSFNSLPIPILKDGLIIDATVGGGGHTQLLLKESKTLRAIGLDQDPFAIKAARQNLHAFGERVEIIHTNFANFKSPKKAVLVLADLGVSSPQLDIAERGFSFRLNGPLDMRMNPNDEKTAKDVIEFLTEEELANLIYKYGEERFSRRIAKRIKSDLREKGSYANTGELAYSIAGCYPAKMRYGRLHPATRTFQALRIEVNNELKYLEELLDIAPEWLKDNGLLCIISFHSLEDRLVKNSFKKDLRLENIHRKPLIAEKAEVISNPRSRSAKLRVAKRIFRIKPERI